MSVPRFHVLREDSRTRQSEYDVGFRTVSLLFVAGFIGAFSGYLFVGLHWHFVEARNTAAAFVNVPLTKAFNFGQAFAISALCLACTYIFVLVDSHFGQRSLDCYEA